MADPEFAPVTPGEILKEEFLAVAAEDVDREGAVEEAGARVSVEDIRDAGFFPLFVCEDHGGHGRNVGCRT